ncbi:MAG TPA: DUF1269 domain-containing protein [Pseudonocardiaceae bacterium]|nr:DUF1269 domain-containing protein [Pseudonocardiaceae bacterium]
MADLVVLGFDNRRDAEEVFELGASLQGEELLDLEDAALAWRDDKGRVRIHQAIPTTQAGAATGGLSGALWGSLLGLLFLNPLAGLVVGGVTGAAAGAATGALTDIGINDDLIRRIGEQLQPGKAAVFALIRRSTPDRVTEAVKRYHPTVLHTNLTRDREKDLVKALQA